MENLPITNLSNAEHFELLNLAAKLDAPVGQEVATLDKTLSNYKKLLELFTLPSLPPKSV